MKSAKNACDGRRSSPVPNSNMPDSYLNSVLTCGIGVGLFFLQLEPHVHALFLAESNNFTAKKFWSAHGQCAHTAVVVDPCSVCRSTSFPARQVKKCSVDDEMLRADTQLRGDRATSSARRHDQSSRTHAGGALATLCGILAVSPARRRIIEFVP